MSKAIERNSQQYLYQQVISMMLEMQASGTLRPGDKLPSLRKLSQQLSLSIPTIKLAYTELERQNVIVAKPKSGYFMKPNLKILDIPTRGKLGRSPTHVNNQSLIEQVYAALHLPDMVSLGIANPSSAHPCDKALARIMRQVLSKAGAKAISYAPTTGFEPLKRQLALRYFDYGLQLNPEEVIVTNGAQEALSIALQCVANKGDVIAIESPAFFGVLELIESLGMMALEIPVCSDDGIWVNDLVTAINKHSIKACLFSTSINNPTGSFMPDGKRKELVELLESHNIPLIEDDVYGDLYFTQNRGTPAQCYAKQGLVLTCSSFSKTAAPGYRIGWLIAGQFEAQARRLKRALSCSSSLINQWTLTEFIAGSEYDRNMHKLRAVLKLNKARMLACINDSFPQETKVSNPKGGGVVWVELPVRVDSEQLFHLAIEKNISIAPGIIFSASQKFKNYIRLSFGMPWTDQVENAIKTLGQLVANQQ